MSYQSEKFLVCRQLCYLQSVKIEIRTNIFIPQKFFRILDWLGLNFNAINLKFVWIIDNYVTTICENFRLIAHKLRSGRTFFIPRKFFHILNRLGLNFKAINLFFLVCFGWLFLFRFNQNTETSCFG